MKHLFHRMSNNDEADKDNATVTTASAAYCYITPTIGKVLHVHYFNFPGRQMG